MLTNLKSSLSARPCHPRHYYITSNVSNAMLHVMSVHFGLLNAILTREIRVFAGKCYYSASKELRGRVPAAPRPLCSVLFSLIHEYYTFHQFTLPTSTHFEFNYVKRDCNDDYGAVSDIYQAHAR